MVCANGIYHKWGKLLCSQRNVVSQVPGDGSEQGGLSCKEPGSKYFRFRESDFSVLTGQLCHCSPKTSTNNTQTNECGCVPMWFYGNRRRPDLAHGLQFANLWLRGKNNWENRVSTDRMEGSALKSSLLIFCLDGKFETFILSQDK